MLAACLDVPPPLIEVGRAAAYEGFAGSTPNKRSKISGVLKSPQRILLYSVPFCQDIFLAIFILASNENFVRRVFDRKRALVIERMFPFTQ